MCKKEEVRILRSSFDVLCSNAVLEHSHLELSSEVYVKSEKYNILCFVVKDFFYGNSEKIAYCVYQYNGVSYISIIFEDNGGFYCYFNQNIADIDITDIESGDINISQLIKKSIYRNGCYYKKNIREKNNNLKNEIIKLNKQKEEEGGNDNVISFIQQQIKIFIYFFESNLVYFSEKTQYINFMLYCQLFLKEDKIFEYYIDRYDIKKEKLFKELNFVKKTIENVFYDSVEHHVKNLQEFSDILESMIIDDEYEQSKYFINCLFLTVQQMIMRDNSDEQCEDFQYIKDTLFSA